MSLFTPETIDRVRDAADIVEIVSAHTDLRRQGERFVGLCPFHEERTPSFSVKPAEGFYYCFGCEAGGDTIRFVFLFVLRCKVTLLQNDDKMFFQF